MKKSIINLFTLVCVSILCATFSSCSSDDEEKITSDLVGTWVYSDELLTEKMIFNSNGSFVDTCNELVDSEIFRFKGTYSIAGDFLTMKGITAEQWDATANKWVEFEFGNINTSALSKVKFSISGNKLTLSHLGEEDDDDPLVYTRE